MTSATYPPGYVVTTSSTTTGLDGWKAFDHQYNTWWLSVVSRYSGTTGLYVGSNSTPGIANNGESIKITFDFARNIKEVALIPVANHRVASFHIMYSLDGINYVSVVNIDNIPPATGVFTRYTFPTVYAKFWGCQIYRVVSDTYGGLIELRFS